MQAQEERLADGRAVQTFRIGRPPGPVVEVMDLGATVRRLDVTGGDGVRRNIALGQADAQEYVGGRFYHGAVVGRYANRIATGRFDLEGQPVTVSVNDRGNHLHGGSEGFHLRTWDVTSAGEDRLELALVSPDGDQGFPGTLTVTATYTVDGPALSLELLATSDRLTVVNLTSHVYLNLEGECAGSIDEHVLHLAADRYLPVDGSGIPCGDPLPVRHSFFDLREPRAIGSHRFDHSWLLDPARGGPAATLASERSGTSVALFTDQPALQVYTADHFDGSGSSTSGAGYSARAGVALEPQLLPDTPNRPTYPSALLRPGHVYRHRMRWEFGGLITTHSRQENWHG